MSEFCGQAGSMCAVCSEVRTARRLAVCLAGQAGPAFRGHGLLTLNPITRGRPARCPLPYSRVPRRSHARILDST